MSTKKATLKPRRSIRHLTALPATEPIETSFAEVVGLIEQARQRAYQAVNTELVGLYWQIGQYVSRKLAAAGWGEGVVDRLAQHLARTMPGLRGFSVQNLWRMRQFNETYRDDPKLSALVSFALNPQPHHSGAVQALRGARVHHPAHGRARKVVQP